MLLTVCVMSLAVFGCQNPAKKPVPPKKNVSMSQPRASAVQTPAPPPVTPGYATNAFEQKVVQLVNIERQKVGHDPLANNLLLGKGARAKAVNMRDKGYFGHTSPTYGSPFKMMSTFGVKYSRAGENIAAGYKTPESVVAGWMKSAGHRANILSTRYGKIGIGYAQGGKLGSYWVQWFTN
jgi:uncharacterized YkwD family protein